MLGIDHGEKRIGLALSDALGIGARQLTILSSRGLEADCAAIAHIAAREGAVGLVVGVPQNPNAPTGIQTQAQVVREWIEQLRARLDLPVYEVSEYLTSQEARQMAREIGRIRASPSTIWRLASSCKPGWTGRSAKRARLESRPAYAILAACPQCEMAAMRDLHDTQPSPRLNPRRDDGLRAPPRWLFCGVILFVLALALGLAGVVFGFREILKPAQQQRVIDQLPFMRVLRKPTPAGGVFPTISAPADDDSALALLDMPLDFASPTSGAASAQVVSATPTMVALLSTATPTPTSTHPPTATNAPPTQVPATQLPADYLPSSARIDGILHQRQTWNNCGPATITMALSYHGWRQPQSEAGDILKPNREDKNVSPHELVGFCAPKNFRGSHRARWRHAGLAEATGGKPLCNSDRNRRHVRRL